MKKLAVHDLFEVRTTALDGVLSVESMRLPEVFHSAHQGEFTTFKRVLEPASTDLAGPWKETILSIEDRDHSTHSSAVSDDTPTVEAESTVYPSLKEAAREFVSRAEHEEAMRTQAVDIQLGDGYTGPPPPRPKIVEALLKSGKAIQQTGTAPSL